MGHVPGLSHRARVPVDSCSDTVFSFPYRLSSTFLELFVWYRYLSRLLCYQQFDSSHTSICRLVIYRFFNCCALRFCRKTVLSFSILQFFLYTGSLFLASYRSPLHHAFFFHCVSSHHCFLIFHTSVTTFPVYRAFISHPIPFFCRVYRTRASQVNFVNVVPYL